ncbi:PREDICTED: chloroplast sensor kinase, chloroplastic isoform X2 [Tarenaya hassleriana]|uniref:chloroplast sensor kinase, chloroplastic isoform X2 n=1 Tax=Tarenaya hassleriana TaxID=28532 RepID=UPI00053C2275|nr:PREDICTED: chloroplast sensor kinase, chloroplastic isoform X2 [Tarenaya hassleriana]
MLLSAISSQTHLSSNPNLVFCHFNPNPRSSNPSLKLLNASSSPSPSSASISTVSTGGLRYVTHTLSGGDSEPGGGGGGGGGETMVTSAAAVASAIRGASKTPVEFVQMIEKDHHKTKLVMPSPDFQRLCLEQLDLFRRIVDPNVVLSVYVRPAGGYVMDRLELRRVTCYPGMNAGDVVVLVGNFGIPAGLRAAEAALSSQQVEVVNKHRAVVFPMVKHPFVVGFLVAELPEGEEEGNNGLKRFPSPEEAYALPPSSDSESPEFQFQSEKRSYAINISRTLAMAYVMDQKSILLQQSSWQNNVRMSKLVEQIRRPLSTIRTLSKLLSIHTERSEIAHDIVEDIIAQGDQIKDTLQELQDAVYLTKTNIVRYNDEALRKMNKAREPKRSELSNTFKNEENPVEKSARLSLGSGSDDSEMPMPPLALAPLQAHRIRKTVRHFRRACGYGRGCQTACPKAAEGNGAERTLRSAASSRGGTCIEAGS